VEELKKRKNVYYRFLKLFKQSTNKYYKNIKLVTSNRSNFCHALDKMTIEMK